MNGYYKDQNPNQFTYLIFFLFVVLIKIIQTFFQILVHYMIWCDDGLPKNSRAKLYSTTTTVSQTQFFSPFFFFILHSIHFWNREYLCVFGGVRKTRVFFWREIQFRHLASDNTLRSKKIPRNAIFYYKKCTSIYFGKTYLIIHHQILSDFYLVLRMKSHIEGILSTYT